jgi:tRNA(fMet)-specific endonuclease VapC
MIVLDTDHISLLERADSPEGKRLRARLEAPDVPPPHVTIISYEEQVRGWMAWLARARSLKVEIEAYHRLRQQLRNYCAFAVLEFDELAAVEFQHLRNSKLRIGTMDLKIAATVLVHKATLLSRNLADFSKIPGLRVEDWTKA